MSSNVFDNTYHSSHYGKIIDTLYPDGHYFLNRTSYTIPDILKKFHYGSTPDPEGAPSYTFSKYGFIRVQVISLAQFASNQKALAGDRKSIGFCVMMKNRYILFKCESGIGKDATYSSDLIPVAKGDTIYWGMLYDRNMIPDYYNITFIPAKSVDATTGD